MGAQEETLGDQVAAGRVGETDGADVFFGEDLEEKLASALFLPKTVERLRERSHGCASMTVLPRSVVRP